MNTESLLAVAVCTWRAGAEPPPHTFVHADRVLVVTAGRFRVVVGDSVVEAGPEDVVVVPRGSRTSIHVVDGECRVTVVVAPAGAQAWLAAAATAGLPTDVVLGMAADHGVVVHPR